MADTYYKHHVFFCTNKREDRRSCEDNNATALRMYAKDKVKAAGLAVQAGVRVNSAGCLNRCGLGPVLVIYPEAVWYTYANEGDIDEIVEKHLLGGELVKRLMVD